MGSEVTDMSSNFAGKKILVAGGGVTGSAVATVLSSYGAEIVIVDDNPQLESRFAVLSPDAISIQDFAGIVVSPGWRESHPLLRAAITASQVKRVLIISSWNSHLSNCTGCAKPDLSAVRFSTWQMII